MTAPRACYLHIPFCARICPYCDFAVVAGRTGEAERYVDALVEEIGRDRPAGPLDAVFIGGGTPSSIPPALIGRVLDALDARHGLTEHAEVSLESNPENLTTEVLEGLAGAGVNRLSIGAQSFDPVVLDTLGREHTPQRVAASVAGARAAGFGSVSVDLIFGDPSETVDSWAASLQRSIDLELDHISTYALTVERGTALSRAVSAGGPAPDEDTQADRYETAVRMLEAAGYRHYEVSNFARPGHECRYNLEVWRHRPYLAYGLGAHGYRDGVRFRNVRALDAYLTRIESGASPRQGEDRVEGWGAELERLMVGLRLRDGIPAGSGGAALAESPEGERLLDAGIISLRDGVLRVERPLFTDTVTRDVLGLEEPKT